MQLAARNGLLEVESWNYPAPPTIYRCQSSRADEAPRLAHPVFPKIASDNAPQRAVGKTSSPGQFLASIAIFASRALRKVTRISKGVVDQRERLKMFDKALSDLSSEHIEAPGESFFRLILTTI